MYVLQKHFCMCGSLSKMSKTLIKEFTFCSEVFFFPLPSQNKTELRPGLQLYTSIYMQYIYSILIEHKQECLKSPHWTMTALHFICMFILPVRGPLFTDNWRTQIIIPLGWKICFYYLRSFAVLLCTLRRPSDCLFIITAVLLSQWGNSKKVPSLF